MPTCLPALDLFSDMQLCLMEMEGTCTYKVRGRKGEVSRIIASCAFQLLPVCFRRVSQNAPRYKIYSLLRQVRERHKHKMQFPVSIIYAFPILKLHVFD